MFERNIVFKRDKHYECGPEPEQRWPELMLASQDHKGHRIAEPAYCF